MDDSTWDFDFDGDGDIDADDDAWGDLIFMDMMLNEELHATQQTRAEWSSKTGSDGAWVGGLVVVALLLCSLFCVLTN
jgi:hypothetical protein